MARVFDNPRYDMQAIRTLRSHLSFDMSKYTARFIRRWGISESGDYSDAIFGIDNEMLFNDLEHIEGFDNEKQQKFDYVYGLNKKLDIAELNHEVYSKFILSLDRQINKLYTDSDAIFRISTKIWSGRWTIHNSRFDNWLECSEIARHAALVGICTDKINTAGAQSHFDNPSLLHMAKAYFPVLCDAFSVAESFRMAFDESQIRKFIKSLSMGDEDFDFKKLEIKRGFLKEAFPSLRFFRIGNLAFILDVHDFYVLDDNALKELHEVLRTPLGFLVYAIGYQPAAETRKFQAIDSFRKIHEYTIKALLGRIDANKSCDTLAKQMKESYSVLLCHAGSIEGDPVRDMQSDAIMGSATELCDGEAPFYQVLLRLPVKIAVDLGTYWNILPSPDADPYLMDPRLQRVMNAPRQYDAALWKRFMDYSRSVLTAHIIKYTKEDYELDNWEFPDDVDDPRDLKWVENCMRGTLDYPEPIHRGKIYLRKVLKWDLKMESWHFNAQDVTHVFSDLTKYQTRRNIAIIPSHENNELLYALKKGPAFSEDISPEDVRIGMNEGKIPGDRVLYLAAKRENTKFGEKVRETASGDDVLREVLSELDMNAQKVAKTLHGVALRMGRIGFEKRMNRMRMTNKNGQVYISLDVSGWSPNMVRENQMEFIDMIMSFYDIPEQMRVSSWFKDIHIVHSRRGFHSIWDMENGSVQGFFGGCDTILHNLMAQFAKVIAEEQNIVPSDTTVDFMTLIDDLAIKVLTGNINIMPVLQSFEDTYRRLGFETDLVKTLVSSTHYHFLNRFFSTEGEVITAAKIFSKSGREWDKKLSDIWGSVDSCLGSVLGSVDRGCSAVTGYEWALVHAIKTCFDSNKRIVNDGWALSHLGMWLPRTFGGWGIPGIVSWVTQEGIDSLTDGTARLLRLNKIISEPETKRAHMQAISVALNQPLFPRSIIEALNNPYGLNTANVPDPRKPARSLMKQAARKFIESRDFLRLLNWEDDAIVIEMLKDLTRTCSYPLAIWASFAECLPGAVLRKILTRAEENETLLTKFSAYKRNLVIKEMRRLNEKAVRHYKTILLCGDRAAPIVERASTLIANKRRLQMELDGIRAFDFETAPSLEVVGNVGSYGSIIGTRPASTREQIYDGKPTWSLVRTYRGSNAIVDRTSTVRMMDPIMNALFEMAKVRAGIIAIGGNSVLICQVFNKIWFGDIDYIGFPHIVVKSRDPKRICNRTTNMGHSVMAYPNFIGGIVINASRAIHRIDRAKKTFDWLSIMTALRALIAVDTELRLSGNIISKDDEEDMTEYNFDLVGHSGFIGTEVIIIEDTSDKFFSKYDKFHGILPVKMKKYVAKMSGLVINAPAGEEMDAESRRDFNDKFGYEPQFTQVVYNPFEILRLRGFDKTAYDMPAAKTFSPLAAVSSDIMELKKTKTKNVDVVAPVNVVKTIVERKVQEVCSSTEEQDIVRAFINFSIEYNNTKNDDHKLKVYERCRSKVLSTRCFKDVLESWGNKHYIQILNTNNIESANELLFQIKVDYLHPNPEGFAGARDEKIQAYTTYASTYNDDADLAYDQRNYSKSYRKRVSSVACSAMAYCTLNTLDAVSTVIHVGEAIDKFVNNVFRRYMKLDFKIGAHRRAVVWLSNRGIWAKDTKEMLRDLIDDTWKHKSIIVNSIPMAINNIEEWIVKDFLLPEAASKIYVNMQEEDPNVAGQPLFKKATIELEVGDIEMDFMKEGEEIDFEEMEQEMLDSIDTESASWKEYVNVNSLDTLYEISRQDALGYFDYLSEIKESKSKGKTDVVQ